MLKLNKILILLFFQVFTLNNSFSQKLCIYFSQKIEVPNLKSTIHSLEYDKSDRYLWIGTDSSLITKREKYSNHSLSSIHDFPFYNITKLKQDIKGYVWICTKKGIYADSKIKKGIIDTSNSPLPDNNITSVDVDTKHQKWFGTSGGIAIFNESTWTILNKSNTDMPSDSIIDLLIYKNHILWAVTPKCLIKFDGTDWDFYEDDDCEILNEATCISIDSLGVIYIGTKKGLIRYFDDYWTCYNNTNSRLPDNWINTLSIDKNNRLYIGTKKGLAVLEGNEWLDFEEYNSKNLKNEITFLTNEIINFPLTSELTVCTMDGIFYYTFEDCNYIKCFELINNIIQNYEFFKSICNKSELVTKSYCSFRIKYQDSVAFRNYIQNYFVPGFLIEFDKKGHSVSKRDGDILSHHIKLLGSKDKKLFVDFDFVNGKWLLRYLSEHSNIISVDEGPLE